MPDYGLKRDIIEIRSGSLYIYPSGSIAYHGTAISASVPQILAITCSSNVNNRLTPPNNTGSYSIISFSTGSNAQRLILRYFSGSYDSEGKITSATPKKYLYKSTGARDRYIDVPILNNDDSLAVAFKTVNSLTKTKGFNTFFSASLDSIGYEDLTSVGIGSITVGDDFIIDQYPGGTGIFNYSSSLGINASIGSTFQIRAGDGLGDLSIGGNFIIGEYENLGTYTFYNLLSGSVGEADFSGSMVQIGGMMIGSSFKIGGSDPLFTHNIIQEGSGVLNQPFYEGDRYKQSASLGFLIDPDDNTSAVITGSGEAKMYFSGSGNIGINTKNPKRAFDIFDKSIGGAEIAVKKNRDREVRKYFQIDDEIGIIKFIADSGSLDDAETSGSAANIVSIVNNINGKGDLGADIIFQSYKAGVATPENIMLVGYNRGDGVFTDQSWGVAISGSLRVLGDIECERFHNTQMTSSLVTNITSSGNISSSGGNIIAIVPDTNDNADHYPVVVDSNSGAMLESQNTL